MTPQTRALIEAAESVLGIGAHHAACEKYARKERLRAAISSAKAAEEGVEERVMALKVENDRLQTSNSAMRRSLEDIANQYAVDCL